MLVPGSGPEEVQAWSKPELGVQTGPSALGSDSSWKDKHRPGVPCQDNIGCPRDGDRHTAVLCDADDKDVAVEGVESGSDTENVEPLSPNRTLAVHSTSSGRSEHSMWRWD